MRSWSWPAALSWAYCSGVGDWGEPMALPDGVGVGVGVVDAEVFEQDLWTPAGNAGDGDGDWRGGRGQVLVVVVPEHDGGFVGGVGGEGVDVGLGRGHLI